RPREVMRVEIDYEPTDELVERPLDPCERPWVRPKRVSMTCLWVPEDFDATTRWLVDEANAIPFLERAEGARRATLAEVQSAHRGGKSFRALFASREVDVPTAPAPWKQAPVIQLGTPTHMHYSTGEGLLYYVEYAEEISEDGRIVSQPADFLRLAHALRE